MPILTLLYQAALVGVAIFVLWALLTGYGLPEPIEWKDDDSGDDDDNN